MRNLFLQYRPCAVLGFSVFRQLLKTFLFRKSFPDSELTMGHGSWVNKSGWVTWVIGQYP